MYGENFGAEGLQDSFTPVQSYHGAPLTGQLSTSVYFFKILDELYLVNAFILTQVVNCTPIYMSTYTAEGLEKLI